MEPFQMSMVLMDSFVYFSRLKRTSPTAYCDCWEKCACKALIPGEQKARLEILQRIVKETTLVTKPNKR